LTAHILQGLWWVGPVLGRWAEAAAYHEEALAIARDLGDDAVTANGLNSQGLAHFWIERDIARAKGRWLEGLEAARRAGASGLVAELLNNLGLVAWREGDLPGARRLQRECLSIRHGLGDQRG